MTETDLHPKRISTGICRVNSSKRSRLLFTNFQEFVMNNSLNVCIKAKACIASPMRQFFFHSKIHLANAMQAFAFMHTINLTAYYVLYICPALIRSFGNTIT